MKTKRTFRNLALTLVLACLSAGMATAQSGTCGANLTWTLSDGTLTISGTGGMYNFTILPYTSQPWYDYRTSITNAVIENGVTSIGDCAFYGCRSLTSVTIPNSVTSIEIYTFAYCSSLTSITIPNSVTSISASAFSGCSSLTSITIPNSVTDIGNYAFEGCSSLTSVTIPNSVTSIKIFAFTNCSNLIAIDVAEDNTNYASENGVLFNKAKTELICCPGGKTGTYQISNSVTSIGVGAFTYCSSLTSVTIPNSVTSIGSRVFLYCSSLTSVTNLAATPQEIDGYAFLGVPLNNATLTVPVGSKALYEAADVWKDFGTIVEQGGADPCATPVASGTTGNLTWTLCPGGTLTISGTGVMPDYGNGTAPWYSYRSTIETIVVENGVTSIGDFAFWNCGSVTQATIPVGVTSIGRYAFGNNYSLLQPTIPSGVTSIGEYAFQDCRSLISVTIPNSVASIGNDAFWSCIVLPSVTIPESVTSIGNGAFYGCRNLTVINVATDNANYASVDGVLFNKTITALVQYPAGKTGAYAVPTTVTSIMYEAFRRCESLTSLTIPASVTSMDAGAFHDCSNLTAINVA